MSRRTDTEGAESTHRMKKRKPLACESCYLSRVKCVYDPKAGRDAACERCTKHGRNCVPRVVVRGKGSGGVDDGPFTRELDLNAYKALEIVEDTPHLTQHYNGAAAFVKTYKALGFQNPPPCLKNLVNLLYLMATKDKSVGRLHAATTLAVSTGVEINMSLLTSKDGPASEEEKNNLQQLVHKRYIEDREAGPCFIVRHDAGERNVFCTSDFEELFIDSSTFAASHLRNTEPHIKVWKDFVVDQKEADAFAAKIMQALMKAEKTHDAPDAVKWTLVNTRPVKIKDNNNNHYESTLYESGWMAKSGFLNYLVFGFRDLKPLTDEGAARLRRVSVKNERRSVAIPVSSQAPASEQAQRDRPSAAVPDSSVSDPRAGAATGPSAANSNHAEYVPAHPASSAGATPGGSGQPRGGGQGNPSSGGPSSAGSRSPPPQMHPGAADPQAMHQGGPLGHAMPQYSHFPGHYMHSPYVQYGMPPVHGPAPHMGGAPQGAGMNPPGMWENSMQPMGHMAHPGMQMMSPHPHYDPQYMWPQPMDPNGFKQGPGSVMHPSFHPHAQPMPQGQQLPHAQQPHAQQPQQQPGPSMGRHVSHQAYPGYQDRASSANARQSSSGPGHGSNNGDSGSALDYSQQWA
eukprot:CAMPEP_0202077712 /NCGR_PEP_ID=MMETSP0964-20121228/5524_1 /ASSEMBLY_ACC=CAM_ASM_000500 /TAXON_ID=4773 /ORGANISM="Schizochytrium aggregatum, Strain ATCC28209" /LENGTH=628 /DNA_ID=CAMNT_0048644995 /DNA_START=1 /DNA_END=1887 /DNA_ORIENTATION=+